MSVSPLKQMEIWKSVQWLSAVLDEMLMRKCANPLSFCTMGAIKGPIFRGQFKDIFLKVSFTCFKHIDYGVETHCKNNANLRELPMPTWGENVTHSNRVFLNSGTIFKRKKK